MHRIIYISNLVVSVPGSEERWSQAGGGRTEADIVLSSLQTFVSRALWWGWIEMTVAVLILNSANFLMIVAGPGRLLAGGELGSPSSTFHR